MDLLKRVSEIWQEFISVPEITIAMSVSILAFTVLYYYMIKFLSDNESGALTALFVIIMLVSAGILTFFGKINTAIYLLIPAIFIIAIMVLYSTEIKRVIWSRKNSKMVDMRNAGTSYDEEKIQNYKERGIDYHEVERIIFLRHVDTKWIEHIDLMDRLKRGISLRAYANEDPLISYKKEGLEMFEDMVASIQEDTVKFLMKIEVEKVPTRVERKEYETNGGSLENRKHTVVNTTTIGRNDPCPCGSGKKYKNCCGRKV